MGSATTIGTCKLCLKQGHALRNSHIIPEFLYKRVYDAKGRFQIFSELKDRPSGYKQKGIREYLLCEKCEGKIGVWEKYVKELLFDRAPKGVDFFDRIEFHGVDYHKFKLFQLSLIWRMDVTSLDDFIAVNLGPRHSEHLRSMLDRCDPGEPYEYGCWLIHGACQIEEIGNAIVLPTSSPRKIMGHVCYRTVLGGFFWGFYVSSHMDQFTPEDIFMTKAGTLPVWKENPQVRKFMQAMIQPLADKFASTQ